MVVEYKKGSGNGVVSQAVSSLSWLDSARHEFGAMAKEKPGADAADAADGIDWRNPRMVCIAAGFSHHDRVAVHRLHEGIDLVRYRARQRRAAEPVVDRVRTWFSPTRSGPARPDPTRPDPTRPGGSVGSGWRQPVAAGSAGIRRPRRTRARPLLACKTCTSSWTRC
ncbi:hypothetical protein ACFY5F_40870 [Streptomyces sp. NPDC013161]|uniref:hypothetical protein n=1 Tax=Streptomyces sp. NPDC013161 TaxID=3364862 RepID=UPI003682022A